MVSTINVSNAKTNALQVVAVPLWLEHQLKRQKLSLYDAADVNVLNRILSKDDVVFYSLFLENVSAYFVDSIFDAKHAEEPFTFFNPKLDFMDYSTYSSNRAVYLSKWKDLDIKEKLEQSGLTSSNGKGFLKAVYGNGKIFITIVESSNDNLAVFSEFAKSLFDAVSRIWTITEVSKTKLFDRYFSDMKNAIMVNR